MSQYVETKRVPIYHHSGLYRVGWHVTCAYHHCENEFDAKRFDASFCSGRCRLAYHRDKKRALRQLQLLAIDARQASVEFSTSQDVYDQMVVTLKALEKALAGFNTAWVQQTLFSPALPKPKAKASRASKAPKKQRVVQQPLPLEAPAATPARSA